MQVCTAITQSHLPWARVLSRSLAAHHPAAAPLVVLVVDGGDAAAAGDSEPFSLLRPSDVGIDRAELHRRAAIYGPLEFTGSMRGALLVMLLAATGGEPVVFLDADIDVLASLDPLVAQVREAEVVLSPHLPGLPSRPAAIERELLRAGAHNCGYVGVAGSKGARFATWWAGHLARDCLNEPSAGLFLSQRWLDLAPSLFDVAMLRDPGANVTAQSLGERDVRQTAAGWTIDSHPLRFLHVSGAFDPRARSWAARAAWSPVAAASALRTT